MGKRIYKSRKGTQAALWGILVAALAANAGTMALAESLVSPPSASKDVTELRLDGRWEIGLDRRYDRSSMVPGLPFEASKIAAGEVWYRRRVHIPNGRWTDATLTLQGARFAPAVFVNGREVSRADGGMAPTLHRFGLAKGMIGHEVTIEIELKSLKDLPLSDASAVPQADRWRTNVSSGLWDSVDLRLHGKSEIERLIPSYDGANDLLTIRYKLRDLQRTQEPLDSVPSELHFDIRDRDGRLSLQSTCAVAMGEQGTCALRVKHQLLRWSPESPSLYTLQTTLSSSSRVVDQSTISLGLREFKVSGLGFTLNGEPFHIREGTVVWQRWLRDPEASNLAWRTDWFEKNVVLRLKGLGANGLRFHLSLPPEKLIDLCDKDGLVLQLEWPFFHGIPASEPSMKEQWMSWLTVAARHPSVVIVQPWNETEESQTKGGWNALTPLLENFPSLAVSGRDLLHIHKYWWSLFENLGLYYDSASQFHQAVMVDEFGGNYLDSSGDPGKYPSVRESLLRFLGEDSSAAERLDLQAQANAKVAEYWRRLDVAGFSPFCILGSPEDGSHWYLGPLESGAPKPVWDALAAAFSPVSLSLEIWDRNFLPGESISLPLHLFNDTDRPASMRIAVEVSDDRTEISDVSTSFVREQPAFAHTVERIAMDLPKKNGHWKIRAILRNPGHGVERPVVSEWTIHTMDLQVPALLRDRSVGVPLKESALRSALQLAGVRMVNPSDGSAAVLVSSAVSWTDLTKTSVTSSQFYEANRRGTPLVILDAGPEDLSPNYDLDTHDALWQQPRPSREKVAATILRDIPISFRRATEPESHIQAAQEALLWMNLRKDQTWLWNGYRGGLIVPADDMETGDTRASHQEWIARGANPEGFEREKYYALELDGYYEFSDTPGDPKAVRRLRDRVERLLQDAPSLRGVLRPSGDVVVSDLGKSARERQTSYRFSSTPLVRAGKGLSRFPVIRLDSLSRGPIVLSELLTSERLDPSGHEPALYSPRFDPAALQFVLNLVAEALQPHK